MDIVYPFLWAFGLSLGSVAGMSISRYQRINSGEEINIISPPSHCPHCKKSLKPMMLIPIFSYIYLKGNSRAPFLLTFSLAFLATSLAIAA